MSRWAGEMLLGRLTSARPSAFRSVTEVLSKL